MMVAPEVREIVIHLRDHRMNLFYVFIIYLKMWLSLCLSFPVITHLHVLESPFLETTKLKSIFQV